jgi:NADH dehydrogenase
MVTGAFGYTGKCIARRLLSTGKQVRTLTRHSVRESPFGDRVSVVPLNFQDPRALTQALQGATTLYNTYWIRFQYGHSTFEAAVENTKSLIRTAQNAGVGRIVHVSVANASEESPLPYFRAKALVEKAVISSGISYAIIRPTLIFGPGDILLNNIAWFLRRFPVFPVFGRGDYQLQPVFVEDVARIAVESGRHTENLIMVAAGPEMYTFDKLVRLIADKIGSRARIVHLRPRFAYLLSKLLGCLVNDVVLTWDEIEGLMANLLVSTHHPTGEMSLSEWLEQNVGMLGTTYASELGRHYRLTP